MNIKELSRVCDSEVVANDCTFEELYNAVATNLVKDASQKVLSWGGADRPGEYLYVGPTSMLVQEFDGADRWERVAWEVLDDEEFVTEDGDAVITDEVKTKILNKIPGYTEGKPFFIYHYDWNDTGDLLALECVDEAGLAGYCLTELDCETYWGLMHAYVMDGYPVAEMRLINANEEFYEDPLVASLIPQEAPHVEACCKNWDYDLMHDFDSEITEGRSAFTSLGYQNELD